MSEDFRQRCSRFVVGVFILSLLLILKGRSVGFEPEPNPALSPADVVRIQVEALKTGRIDIVFRFASRQNKAYAGPLSRFTEMLKSPTYIAMLQHGSVSYGPLRKQGGQAYQTVFFAPRGGKAVRYVFVLSKSYSDACDGCWVTDSITRVEPLEPMQET